MRSTLSSVADSVPPMQHRRVRIVSLLTAAPLDSNRPLESPFNPRLSVPTR